ncbi:3-phosphoshikimate 1-carboxyvinyltransferase [uncultured Propionibacterium sp.]|uniref:3-phosphoshikimate 1-carboxyvinyltransferase n=1 Tax=uncultured Propionibacterium sp. TaxID=218066 RepID=UPI00292DD28F|nr:3-phosphoshikimate 1-carboxyvinyltransferase [uncultured Propionibacterium sp.]
MSDPATATRATGPSAGEHWQAPCPGRPLHAVVEVPGSKSESNRALVLAALSDGPSTIRGVLEARDTRLMIDALRALGAGIEAEGTALRVSPGPLHAAAQPIDCGLAGTVMRFVPPIAALAGGSCSFIGDERAGGRPVAPLLDALRQLGASIDADAIPFTLNAAGGLTGDAVRIDSSTSSQYVSGLMLVGARLPRGLDIVHTGTAVPSAPHIVMTIDMAARHRVRIEALRTGRHWRVHPGAIAAFDERIEPDLTNAAVFLVAGVLTGGTVTIAGWPRRSAQPGSMIRAVLARMGAAVAASPEGLGASGALLAGTRVDLHEASELTPVVAALAVAASGTTAITGVAHIRGHETDRIRAIATELGRLGVPVRELPEGLAITGMAGRLGQLHPSEGDGLFACHRDHRMAHLGALMGLIVPGVRLDDVDCTTKTMPDFIDRWNAMVDAR